MIVRTNSSVKSYASFSCIGELSNTSRIEVSDEGRSHGVEQLNIHRTNSSPKPRWAQSRQATVQPLQAASCSIKCLVSCAGLLNTHILCYAILLPGRKPIFRAGIRPDSDRESFEIGQKAHSEAFPIGIRPKSGPEIRFPARKHYRLTESKTLLHTHGLQQRPGECACRGTCRRSMDVAATHVAAI